MPRMCCVPECKSNYRSEKPKTVSTFKFPKDEDLKNKWIQAIPRKNFVPSDSSVVCSKHFSEEMVIRVDYITRADGSILRSNRIIPKLSPHAVPRIFPNQTSYQSSSAPLQHEDPLGQLKRCEEHDAKQYNISVMRPHLKRIAIPSLCLPQTVTEDSAIEKKKEKSSKKRFHSVARKKIRKVKIDNAFVSSTNSTFDEKEKQHETDTEAFKLGHKKRNLIDEELTSDEVEDCAENKSFHRYSDSEAIFGQYVASEMRTLKDDPLLYLQTKQSILETLTNANFELINSE